jgi:hypothetical protein
MLRDSSVLVAVRNACAVALLFSPIGTPLAQTTVAGFTPGNVRAADSGAAEYRVALGVPPGIAGMAPKLALSYSSQAGNGPFGVGWNLEGLSAVGRCPQTLAQDNMRGAVNFNANDRFCLDGQRLLLVSGTYGGDGAEYRTERASFAKIVSNGYAGGDPANGPAWFKVWTKAGQIFEYGNSANSRIKAQGKTAVRVWAVNRIEDTKSNYITVTYIDDSANGDFRLDRIDYTGNVSASTAPTASVRLTYETRTDVHPEYHAGSVTQTLKRATHVKTFVGENVVTEYRIAYDPAAPRSRIVQIKECVDVGAKCFSPLSFTWTNGSASYSTWSWTSTAIGALSGYTHYFADVNGDGKADWIQVSKTSNNAYVGLSNEQTP